MRFPPRARLLSWVAVIAIAVVPWTDFQNHTHWRRVQWIPFVTPPIKIVDIVINVLLYIPFGYFYAQQRPGRRGNIWRALVIAAALSIFTEWTQLYSHSRFPSLTDVTNNLIGTAIGAFGAGFGI